LPNLTGLPEVNGESHWQERQQAQCDYGTEVAFVRVQQGVERPEAQLYAKHESERRIAIGKQSIKPMIAADVGLEMKLLIETPPPSDGREDPEDTGHPMRVELSAPVADRTA
jgi:hypothetical protein